MYNLTNPSNLFQSSMLSHFPIFRTSCYSISPTPNLRSLKISLWIKIFLSTCYRTYIRAKAMGERLWMISSPPKTSHQTWSPLKTSHQTWSPPQTLCSPRKISHQTLISSPRKISHQTSISSPRKICLRTSSPPSWTPHSCLKVKEASQSQTSCKYWAGQTKQCSHPSRVSVLNLWKISDRSFLSKHLPLISSFEQNMTASVIGSISRC